MRLRVDTVLPEPVWRARQAEHEARVDVWTAPFLARRARREPHAVEDFLFTYYRWRPAQLRRWSPGAGVVLQGAAAGPGLVEVDGGAAVAAPDERTLSRAAETVDLLRRTAARPASFGCFGLHEWAMVHRSAQLRHERLPLRLSPAATDAVVESLPVRCTHWDAFRFFTPTARPLNQLQPTREARPDLEQPGCLHATMDLYEHAFRLWPHVSSELVADAFALARRVRELDMRASPYDLSALGLTPVRVETPEGRAEYAAAQRGFAQEGTTQRARLLEQAGALAGPVEDRRTD